MSDVLNILPSEFVERAVYVEGNPFVGEYGFDSWRFL
jgi:hypothetical protein